MTEVYKIFAGKYDNNTTEWITGKCIEKQHDTRNTRFALQQSHVHYDMRKFNFSNRIIPIWNSGVFRGGDGGDFSLLSDCMVILENLAGLLLPVSRKLQAVENDLTQVIEVSKMSQ